MIKKKNFFANNEIHNCKYLYKFKRYKLKLNNNLCKFEHVFFKITF